MATNTNILFPQTPFIDPSTGRPSLPWVLWLQNPSFVNVNLANALPISSGGTGISTAPTNGQLLIGNAGVYSLHTLTPSSGISVTNGAGLITVANTGVLSNIASSGISVSGATGNVTIANTGVLSAIAGSGISVSGATGNVTFANTGVLSFSGGSTGLTPATATTGAVSLAGTLAVAYGGTGQTTYTDGQLLIGNTTGNTLAKSTLTAGTGISISNGSGSITIANTLPSLGGTVTSVSVVTANGLAGTVATATTTPAITLSTTITGVLKGNGTAISAATSGTDYAPATSGTSILYGNGSGGFSNVTIGSGISFVTGTLSATGSGGTVTSVGLSLPSIFTVSGSPVTGTGTLTGTFNTQTANYVFAGPTTGAAATPTFRALVSADIPSLSYVSSITSSTLTVAGTSSIPTINLTSGIVTAGTTGSVTLIPVITVDTYGRVTAVTTVANPQGTVTSVAGTGTVNGITLTGTVTSSGSLTLGGTLGSIANSQLSNSTISGVSLGGNLFSLTAGTGVSFSAGTTYNGSAAITITATGSGGTVTSVSGTSPISSSGGTTPTISITQSSATTNGYLSSTDWSTFNGKQAALVSGTNIKTVNGTTLLGSGDVGTITYAYGGTGQTTVTTGDLLYGSATNTWSKLGIGTTGQILRVVSGAPAWGTDYVGTVTSVGGTGTVNGITLTGTVTSSGNLTLGGTLSNVSLTTQVSGTLPVGNGGTGLTTLASGYIPYGNGTSAFSSSSGFTYNGNTLTATTGVSGNSNVLSLVNSNTAAGGIGVSIRGYSSNGSNNLGQIDFGGAGALGGNIDFYTANGSGTNTFSLRLASSNGNLQFQQSNAGIVFNNSSASVNSTLNDYEQGTWTPGVTSSTGSITSYTSSGTYTKIGRLVTITGNITITNGGTASGIILLSGLPFTNSLAQQVFGVCREAQLTGIIYFASVQSSGTTGFIQSVANGSVTFTNTSIYYFSVTYTATF